MRYSILLNGCSETFLSRAREMHGFAREHLGSDFTADRTIILCRDFKDRDKFLGHTFTSKLVLLCIGDYSPEKALAALADISLGSEIILLPGDFFGAEISVRLALRLDGGYLTGANKIEIKNSQLICEKKVYSQKMTADLRILKFPACISLARGAAEEVEIIPEQVPEVEVVELDRTSLGGDEFIVSTEMEPLPESDGLAEAEFLLVGGKGLGGPNGVAQMKELADISGAAWGVSRPVAMSGWAPMERLIGVSGAMAKPELCLTFGASGAAALFAGIEKGKKIISINRDSKAPVIRQSDAAAVCDCLAIIDELTKLVQAGNIKDK